MGLVDAARRDWCGCCQILDDLDASMHYQVKYEYNATATYSNRTDTDVYRVTTAWDTLQVQVYLWKILGLLRVEGWKGYWCYFRFMSGRKWITRQGFGDDFCSASRRWTRRTSSYRGGIGRGTRDRREFYFRSRYFRSRPRCKCGSVAEWLGRWTCDQQVV